MHTRESIKAITLRIFEEIGVDITNQEAVNQMDSVQYVSALVGLEDEFNIQFPDEILVRNIFQEIDEFYEMLILLVEEQSQ